MAALPCGQTRLNKRLLKSGMMESANGSIVFRIGADGDQIGKIFIGDGCAYCFQAQKFVEDEMNPIERRLITKLRREILMLGIMRPLQGRTHINSMLEYSQSNCQLLENGQ